MKSLKKLPFHLFLAIVFISNILFAQEDSTETGEYFRTKAKSFQKDNSDSAIFYASKALDYYENEGDTLMYIDTQQYLGVFQIDKDNFAKADSILNLNWKLAKQYLSPSGEDSEKETYANSASQLALTQLKLNNYPKCIELFEIAIPIFESTDLTKKLMLLYNNAGIC
ncbi:MAG: hypothetical protein AAGA10_04865, partial [Bacteroidota bacterium]